MCFSRNLVHSFRIDPNPNPQAPNPGGWQNQPSISPGNIFAGLPQMMNSDMVKPKNYYNPHLHYLFRIHLTP